MAAPTTRFDPLAYRDPHPRPALIRALGPINHHLVLRRLLKVRRLDLPAADLARLRAAVNPETVAFLGPNHPEFMTDWMIDKEISRLCSPLMAHWASWEIVNLNPWVQAFWLDNNLISNAPGGGGKEYSVRWALQGHGVLLHPEGTATWNGDRIGPLVPGIVDMAWEACGRLAGRHEARSVFVVPLLWKLRFTADVSSQLHREMALIERRLRLPASGTATVEARFARLQKNVLAWRYERFGHPRPAGRVFADREFFRLQGALANRLLDELRERYGESDEELTRTLHALRRAIRKRKSTDPEGARRDRSMMEEIERLHRFKPELYDRATLTQEQIAENLKQIRSALVRRGWRNAMHNLVPVSVAPRVAHVRIPEPLAVSESFSSANAESAKGRLLAALRDRMQGGLDALNAEIAPSVDRFRRPNPLWTGARD